MKTEYFVDTYWRVYLDASNDVIMVCNLRVNDRSNDPLVSILEQIVTDKYDLDKFSFVNDTVFLCVNAKIGSFSKQDLKQLKKL